MKKCFQILHFINSKFFSVLFLIHTVFIISVAQINTADFALYVPSYENDGVWEEEVIALKTMFSVYGWSYNTIDHLDLHNQILFTNANLNYKALISPGGYAGFRDFAISPIGKEHIRQFISMGGNYISFCAGSFWASDSISWAEISTGGSGSYNQENDYQKYNYNLNLFSGMAKGPFGWTPWNNGYNASLELVKINKNNPTMNFLEISDTTRSFYYGGPFFEKIDENVEVWATAIPPYGLADEAKIGEGMPTIIKFNYGLGKVVLFSYHPEILIDSKLDNIVLSEFIDEENYDWVTGNLSQQQINFDSWNIVHAALQIVANENVTKLNSLPVILNLRIYLEGPYLGNNNMSNALESDFPNNSPYTISPKFIEDLPNNIVDWILVELREEPNGIPICTKSFLLHKDGNIVHDDGISKNLIFPVKEGSYYLVVKHRNHLPIMSSVPVFINSD